MVDVAQFFVKGAREQQGASGDVPDPFAQGGQVIVSDRLTVKRDLPFSGLVEGQDQADQCKELGHPPAEVALAWLLHNPVVTAPIIGPRTMEQLESAVQAASIALDQDTLTKLDEIFPGPGGEAPMAYAW